MLSLLLPSSVTYDMSLLFNTASLYVDMVEIQMRIAFRFAKIVETSVSPIDGYSTTHLQSRMVMSYSRGIFTHA